MTNKPSIMSSDGPSTTTSDAVTDPFHGVAFPPSEASLTTLSEETTRQEETTQPGAASPAPGPVPPAPGPVPPAPLAALSGPLTALLAEAQVLSQQGGLSKHATETQKWQAADLIYALQRAVEVQRDRLLDPFTPVTSEAKENFQRSSLAYDTFLGDQERTRGTLVDAALTVATFPPGHSVRQGALSFSHARTLSRLKTERERTVWAARAVREGLSVARLWSLILTGAAAGTSQIESAASGFAASPPVWLGLSSGALPAEEEVQNDTEAGDDTEARDDTEASDEAALIPEAYTSEAEAFSNIGGSNDRRRHHAQVCALTGQAIGDLATMVELRVRLDAAGAAALFPGRGRSSPQGGAARRGVGGVPGSFPVLLRFADLAAVESWLAAWRRIQVNEDRPRQDVS